MLQQEIEFNKKKNQNDAKIQFENEYGYADAPNQRGDIKSMIKTAKRRIIIMRD